MKKDEAARLLRVSENTVREFEEKDPFNPWSLRGYITSSNLNYGSMVLYKIDNYLTEQIIIGTPKQRYPFDRMGRFRFPTTKRINIYTKLDGTNILSYSYKIKGKRFITYKSRLNPVLRYGRFGDFPGMWKEMLEKYSLIPLLCKKWAECRINLSFELFGSKNKHLIEYDILLDTNLLFGIRNDIENPVIIDPKFLRVEGVPTAPFCTEIKSFDDLYSWYQKLRNEQESVNQSTEDGHIKGSEGFVWYLQDINNKVHQFKCKPESVEQIHWASGINKNAIWTTIINAYESNDEVTYEIVKELLMEEFEEQQIDLKKDLILQLMEGVLYEFSFKERVLEKYKELNKDIGIDKREVMRYLSKFFDRKEMSKVYNTIICCDRPVKKGEQK